MKRLTALLILTSTLPAQTPTCVWAQFGNLLKCVAPSALGITAAPAPPITGGPCASADGSLALFVKLPDGSCLPVIATGTFQVKTAGLVDQQNRPVAVGTVAQVAGGVNLLAGAGVAVVVPAQ